MDWDKQGIGCEAGQVAKARGRIRSTHCPNPVWHIGVYLVSLNEGKMGQRKNFDHRGCKTAVMDLEGEERCKKQRFRH